MARTKKSQSKTAEEVVMDAAVSQEETNGKAAGEEDAGEAATGEETTVDESAVENADGEETDVPAEGEAAVLNKEKEYVITAPTAYSGVIGKVNFVRGVGRTKDQWKAGWFRTHGYRVEEV